mgnify:CR=1 FL=1
MHSNPVRSLLRTLALAASTAFTYHALAQTAAPSTSSGQAFPTKPIRLIIGFTAGSEVDVIGRMIAQETISKQFEASIAAQNVNHPQPSGTHNGRIIHANMLTANFMPRVLSLIIRH